eukprot:gene11796-biopygen16889
MHAPANISPAPANLTGHQIILAPWPPGPLAPWPPGPLAPWEKWPRPRPAYVRSASASSNSTVHHASGPRQVRVRCRFSQQELW